MVNIKKVITLRTDDTLLPKLREAGYDKIVLYYYPHPKHQAAGLLPEQMLATAWHYKPRPDRENKKVGQ